MTRQHLQKLTKVRLKEAWLLYKTGNYCGAYYLAGYSIELSLKACISRRQFKRNQLPAKEILNKIFIHDLNQLVKTAGLEIERKNFEQSNGNFASYWSIVKDWNESSRYEVIDPVKAEDLIKSITALNGGVLRWIQQYW